MLNGRKYIYSIGSYTKKYARIKEIDFDFSKTVKGCSYTKARAKLLLFVNFNIEEINDILEENYTKADFFSNKTNQQQKGIKNVK